MDAPRRTPQGFLVAPASLTRAGVFTYYNADGTPRREYRPTSEVFNADSLKTLVSAPVTDLHPPVMVDASNRSQYDKGNVGDNIVRDGQRVSATIYVKDGKLIASIERGDGEEISCGYLCDLEQTAGVVPEGEPDAGQHFDAIQRNISYNHAAILPRGRAGSSVRLHLDAAGDAVFPLITREQPMHKERINGVDYDVGTPAHADAVSRRDAAEKQRNDAADALQKEHEQLKARADMAEGDAKKLAAEVAELKKPERMDAAVAARVALVDRARKLAGDSEFKADGLTETQIRVAALALARPDVKLDGKSDEYVSAAFDLATPIDPAHRTAAVTRGDADGKDPVAVAQQKLSEHTAGAWNQKS